MNRFGINIKLFTYFQSPKDEVAKAVECALDNGYRHIDTAYNYLNEEGVGDGLHAWLEKTQNKRNSVFVVTKVLNLAYVSDF